MKRFQSRGNDTDGYVAYDTALHAIGSVVWDKRVDACNEADALNQALLAEYSVGELQLELARRNGSLPNYCYYIAQTREVQDGFHSEWEAIQAGYLRYCKTEYQQIVEMRLHGFESYAQYVDGHKKTYTKADGTSFALFLDHKQYPDILAYEVEP